MKLWLLRPMTGLPEGDPTRNPWEPWYDKAFGFVVRAETEAEARKFADEEGGDENERFYRAKRIEVHPWLNGTLSTCLPLENDGEPGVVLKDFASA